MSSEQKRQFLFLKCPMFEVFSDHPVLIDDDDDEEEKDLNNNRSNMIGNFCLKPTEIDHFDLDIYKFIYGYPDRIERNLFNKLDHIGNNIVSCDKTEKIIKIQPFSIRKIN